jgi:hypothetical protein
MFARSVFLKHSSSYTTFLLRSIYWLLRCLGQSLPATYTISVSFFCCDKTQLTKRSFGEERVYLSSTSTSQSIIERRQVRNSRQELGSKNWSRSQRWWRNAAYWLIPPALLHFLSDIPPGPSAHKVDQLRLNRLSIKKMPPTFLPTSQSDGSIVSTDVPSQMTLVCVVLAKRLANAGTLCFLLII